MDLMTESLRNQLYVSKLRRLADRLEAENNQFTLLSIQEGQSKTINGMRYVWKKGKSGKARWHRTDREKAGPPVNHAISSTKKFEGRGKEFYPHETQRNSSLKVPIYGNEGRIDRELDPGEQSAPKTSTYEGALRRSEKNAAVEYVANRPYIKTMIHTDSDGDGVADGARVGIPGNAVQPPPPIRRVKGLNGEQQVAEAEFIAGFERNRNVYVKDATERSIAQGKKKGAGGPIFETDDVKNLAPAHWAPGANRADNNVALHQVANAVCKKAFKDYIATLPKGSNILVTCGGCGAGKGHILGNNPLAKPLMGKAQAVWDSAGDQNATENPWIQEEAEKHGHKVTYMYVHADPLEAWAGKYGVVQRALNPDDGRMVTARVFADSYALGSKSHKAFAEKHKHNPNAKFMFFRNGANPEMIAGIPPEAEHDPDTLYEYALGVIDKRHDLPPYIRSAATFKFGD